MDNPKYDKTVNMKRNRDTQTDLMQKFYKN